MANIKPFIAGAEELFQKTWDKYLSKRERDHDLPLSKFLKSESVNKNEFRKWRDANGLSLPKSKQHARKTHKNKLKTHLTMKKEIDNQIPIRDSDNMILNNPDTTKSNAKQYWWLNVDAKVLNMDKAENGEIKTLTFDSINRITTKKNDVQFFEWISRYLVDSEDNPHLGIPIAQRELAINLMDYCNIKVDEKNLKKTYKRIRDNLDDYLRTSAYVCNPRVVLSTVTDQRNKFRRCAAWQYPKNEDGSIPTDKEGRRLPRELNKKAPYSRVYYFYRKSEVPHHFYDPEHVGEKDYVQAAPETDPEIGYPNIRNIRIISPVPIKEGDFVIASTGKKIVAFLDVVSVDEGELVLKIGNKLPYTYPISSLKKADCNFIPEKGLGFFPIAKSDFDCILGIIDKFMKYSKEDLLNEAYIDETTIDGILHALGYKKNIILQGVPGVGKTYLAKRLAYAMMEHKDEDRVCVVQFHPNYTYEDFIIGYKPCDDGKFQLKPGVFMEFCKKAEEDQKDNKYFFIIDEINRGNLSKIFGEAFTLIDKDHRGESIKLANSDDVYKEFEIPENVYIIGLMNTADRSLAMLDIALQRRFEFLPLKPVFETKSFKKYMESLGSDFEKVINSIIELNKEIEKEPALGEGFCIGHSYFCISNDRKKEYEECQKDIKAWLINVIHYEIIPILRSYCFDEKDTFDRLSTPLLEVLK